MAKSKIHKTAIISPKAKIHSSAVIGAYSVIEEDVEIGEDTELRQHVIIEGPTKIGSRCRIFPFASIGLEPQDKKFQGEKSRLVIGDENMIREYVTINRGTSVGGGITKLGSRGWIMAYCHIAHDCIIGDDVIMANGTTLGGHVIINDHAITGGMTGVHQFCRIGEYAITGGQSMITQDVVPYVIAAGNRAKIHGVNIIGLERKGFSPGEIAQVNSAYRLFFKSGLTKDEALNKIQDEIKNSKTIDLFIQFIKNSERGVCR
ncbi:MAG: acyl-ACP--UDP-N-acetylglucosamine O-acyltransferase [Deltaproteobacteria bacterium]|nr:acyl-ACP--UDP-N-acetylglucosamine O-acyltransferase [Deltaproteobacteria bacterium]